MKAKKTAVFTGLFLLWAIASQAFPVLIVDKSTHKLHFATYNVTTHDIVLGENVHALTGKVVGDKVRRNDLKTPEGIYFFTTYLKTPGLKPKFGPRALLSDYPNIIDAIDGRSGDDIMLHGTNEPERLKREYDSEGCVVVDNPIVEKAVNMVKLGMTPFIIYDELKPEYLKPRAELKTMFDGWLKAWSSKNTDAYIDYYSDQFISAKMNKAQYKSYKQSLNAKYSSIKVDASEVYYFYHPKYSIISFTQHYQSNVFKSSGTKLLYVRLEEGRYKILREVMKNEKNL